MLCDDGYTLVNGDCIKCNVDNCKKCEEDNKCKECEHGYTLDETNNKCIPECDDNCKCDKPNKCKECNDSKDSLVNGKCYSCDVPKCE